VIGVRLLAPCRLGVEARLDSAGIGWGKHAGTHGRDDIAAGRLTLLTLPEWSGVVLRPAGDPGRAHDARTRPPPPTLRMDDQRFTTEPRIKITLNSKSFAVAYHGLGAAVPRASIVDMST